MEEEIQGLEAELTEKTNEVQGLIQGGGRGADIEDLYRSIARTQAEIEKRYETMEDLLSRIDGLKTGA